MQHARQIRGRRGRRLRQRARYEGCPDIRYDHERKKGRQQDRQYPPEVPLRQLPAARQTELSVDDHGRYEQVAQPNGDIEQQKQADHGRDTGASANHRSRRRVAGRQRRNTGYRGQEGHDDEHRQEIDANEPGEDPQFFAADREVDEGRALAQSQHLARDGYPDHAGHE